MSTQIMAEDYCFHWILKKKIKKKTYALIHLFLDESNHIPHSFLVSLIVLVYNYIIFVVQWLFTSWDTREAQEYWSG